MSIFTKLFSKGFKAPSSSDKLRTSGAMTPEHRQLVEFYCELKELLAADEKIYSNINEVVHI